MSKNGQSSGEFFPEIWNILHDGMIVAVEGTVPGDLRIDMEIDYLRKRIPDPGTLVQVLLFGCTRFAFRKYDSVTFSTVLTEIAAMRPEMVSASIKDGLCEIDCVDGTLEVAAGDGAIRLDNGRAITLRELKGIAASYWKEWRERWAKVGAKPKE